MATQKQLQQMAGYILEREARWVNGRLAIYTLPSGDGGGRYEVAGINDKYHPEEFRILASLIRAGKHKEAEQYARDYFLRYSNVVSTWSAKSLDPGIEFFLRDSAINRGPTGAAYILQHALGVNVDGRVGPVTRGALETAMPSELLPKLRVAREWYEREKGRDERSKFWRGLVNRWNSVTKRAKENFT